MSFSPPALGCANLSFCWPDGTRLFDGLQWAAGPGRTGLIGLNGAGKSTLLKLLAGDLTPTSGTVTVTGHVGYLPQDAGLDTSLRVDDALGIAAARAALHAIEAGDTGEEHFAAVGDDWDVEERARATLDALGLERIGLDRTVGDVSGGESVLLRLAALLLRRPDVLLLDEPTNSLDLRARRRLYAAVEEWHGLLVVVSHDRELLERVDQIADLRGGRVQVYGGNLTAYEEALEIEQNAAERTLRAAEADVKRQKRELAQAQVTLAHRARYGQKMYDNKREPRVVMRARKRQAEVSAGKYRAQHADRLAQARERLDEAQLAVRDDAEVRIDLPHTAVPTGRSVLTLSGVELRQGTRVMLDVHGPDRIALLGANGSGKSTLLRTIAGEIPAAAGQLLVHVPTRYLPQRLDVLDDEATVAENVAAHAPSATDNAVRARLARFLFRGGRADRPAGSLSGGERFRATLAALMLAEPAPQLLMLDEPTNNLDMASVRQLTGALAAYQGALVVASHDMPFLYGLGVTRWLRIEEGVVREVKEDDL